MKTCCVLAGSRKGVTELLRFKFSCHPTNAALANSNARLRQCAMPIEFHPRLPLFFCQGALLQLDTRSLFTLAHTHIHGRFGTGSLTTHGTGRIDSMMDAIGAWRKVHLVFASLPDVYYEIFNEPHGYSVGCTIRYNQTTIPPAFTLK